MDRKSSRPNVEHHQIGGEPVSVQQTIVALPSGTWRYMRCKKRQSDMYMTKRFYMIVHTGYSTTEVNIIWKAERTMISERRVGWTWWANQSQTHAPKCRVAQQTPICIIGVRHPLNSTTHEGRKYTKAYAEYGNIRNPGKSPSGTLTSGYRLAIGYSRKQNDSAKVHV